MTYILSNSSEEIRTKKREVGNESLYIGEHLKDLLQYSANNLKGSKRRIFMAKAMKALGKGGQRALEKLLGWNRSTIRKGEKELISGEIKDDFSARGRKKVEEIFPMILSDIKEIADSESQTDPTFRTTKLYAKITAKEVRKELAEKKGYRSNKCRKLPTIRSINNKLNDLGYKLKTVTKSKPLKKIAETDEIFEFLHKVNKRANEMDEVVRLSMDAKAKIQIGPFSRGGKNRLSLQACDHDFSVEEGITPWGIHLPVHNDTFLYFTRGPITADFIVDSLEDLWSTIKEKFSPKALVINLDNGVENNSHRTQFIKRIIDFVQTHNVAIYLAYYPPYHSKYNPIERVWGVLENYWNGEILDSEDKILSLAKSMTYNGKHPIVKLVQHVYKTGVSLTQKAMKDCESMIERLPGLEKWFVSIFPNTKMVL